MLSVSQFKRFMEVIKKLGDRVEKEHDQFLRDSQRIEDRSSTPINGITTGPAVGGVDFESLVGSGGATTVKADTVIDSSAGWDDDVWGSILGSGEPPSATNPSIPPPAQPQYQTQSSQSPLQTLGSPPVVSVASSSRSTSISRSSRGLGATPVPASSFNSSAFAPQQSRPSLSGPVRSSLSTSSAPQSPQSHRSPPQVSTNSFSAAPNYNISLPPAQIMPSAPVGPTPSAPPMMPMTAPAMAPTRVATQALPTMSSPPLFAAPSIGNVLTPSRPPQPVWPGTTPSGGKQLTKDDWEDFDPLA